MLSIKFCRDRETFKNDDIKVNEFISNIKSNKKVKTIEFIEEVIISQKFSFTTKNDASRKRVSTVKNKTIARSLSKIWF